jgi:hypothetical protein
MDALPSARLELCANRCLGHAMGQQLCTRNSPAWTSTKPARDGGPSNMGYHDVRLAPWPAEPLWATVIVERNPRWRSGMFHGQADLRRLVV